MGNVVSGGQRVRHFRVGLFVRRDILQGGRAAFSFRIR